MEHPLASRYGLTANELLDLINARFRLRVALEGGVAEYQMEKHVARLVGSVVARYQAIDRDGEPDFRIWLKGRTDPIAAECKNARNKSYMAKGVVTHYAVEIQKTRAAKGDPTSRNYDIGYFHVIGVCLGKITGDWSDFVFIKANDLTRHATYPNKIAVMHRVPIEADFGPWSPDLATILNAL